ncbi:hypothetical protein CHLRE_12g520050v5 [Chlamydomonas reinhardtii]|uniref:Uncharacterized protein n=1 Tax=Chlamydomonas reinhardtii TaxID=3055 RepID=A8J613_CHLRE|nr:uncharacterized protein CHLRE_12g520050v5 [Chlamydomonas reinhardtii]PNW75271.1 hypothetical protein CHLRE_12g520050v5 [Chlamydomonas reinhardtii]|eukprot:XP_001697064.1 predicted protein [Chlamydomonas reinhardtii]
MSLPVSLALFLWLHGALASTQTRSDVDIRGLSFTGSSFTAAGGPPGSCRLLETFGGVNEAKYRDWASGTGAPISSTSFSIDGMVSEYPGSNEEECACLAGPRSDPCWFALGLVFAVTDKYFSKQAPSAPALGLASFNVNPTARRFALTGTISFNEWLFTIPSLPEGSPAPDLHFTFNMAAQSCDRNAQAPGGTANPSRFMKNFVSFWNPGNLSISASTRWRCTVAAPANLIRVSLDGNVIPIATAVITASSAKQVTVEAGTVATMSQLPRPVLS